MPCHTCAFECPSHFLSLTSPPVWTCTLAVVCPLSIAICCSYINRYSGHCSTHGYPNLGLTPSGGVTQVKQQPLLASRVHDPHHISPTMRPPRTWWCAPYLKPCIQLAHTNHPYDGSICCMAVSSCLSLLSLAIWAHGLMACFA